MPRLLKRDGKSLSAKGNRKSFPIVVMHRWLFFVLLSVFNGLWYVNILFKDGLNYCELYSDAASPNQEIQRLLMMSYFTGITDLNSYTCSKTLLFWNRKNQAQVVEFGVCKLHFQVPQGKNKDP